MNYELAFVIDGEATAAKKKAVAGTVEKIIKINKGKVNKVHDWGKRELAYPIDNHTTGIYQIYELELDSAKAAEVIGKLKLEEDIIRYLLIKN